MAHARACATEGDFWQADHVLAVHMGGGESDLSNFQTLCTPCHMKKTTREVRVILGEEWQS